MIFGLRSERPAKSTAVRVLTTLTHPDAGHALVAGHDELVIPAACGAPSATYSEGDPVFPHWTACSSPSGWPAVPTPLIALAGPRPRRPAAPPVRIRGGTGGGE